MFGSVGSWLYKALAGINLAAGSVGFEKIRIAPQMVRDLHHAAGSTRTVRGEVSSSWSRDGQSVQVDVVIPVGSEAEVIIPKFNLENIVITEGDQIAWDARGYQAGVQGIRSVEKAPTGFLIKIGSGRYSFRLRGD